MKCKNVWDCPDRESGKCQYDHVEND